MIGRSPDAPDLDGIEQFDPYAGVPQVPRDHETERILAAGPLSQLLTDVQRFLERFMHFETTAQAVAVSLWIIGTYVFGAYEVTPFLHIRSPEKRSGKTLLMDLLRLLCRSALPVANISTAALYRVVEQRQPTLLIDEVDAIFPKGRRSDPSKEELRGIINAAYRKGVIVLRSNKNGDILEFSIFTPIALAGIGELPDTIADRCIPIVLQRKPKSRPVERFRLRKVTPQAEDLAFLIELATTDLTEVLSDSDPVLPEALNDREHDTWELLFAVADFAGGHWPETARAAAIELSADATDASETVGVRLLTDLRSVWKDEEPAVPTSELLNRLCSLEESPWSNWYGREIDARFLAQKLKPYGVMSRTVKHLGKTPKGYRREHLEPVWDRYVGVTDGTVEATGATIHTGQGLSVGNLGATQGQPEIGASEGGGKVAHRLPTENPYTATGIAPVAQVAPARQPTCAVCGLVNTSGEATHATCDPTAGGVAPDEAFEDVDVAFPGERDVTL